MTGPVVMFLALALLGAARADAQSPSDPIGGSKAPELFATLGYWRLGSDEGAIGHGPSVGGGALIPLWRALAFAVDLRSGEVLKPFTPWHPLEYRTRRTLIVPGVVSRFGTRRVYGYVSAGVGAEIERSRTRWTGRPPAGQAWREVAPDVFELNQSDTGRTLSGTAGFTAFPTRRIGLRAEVFIASWHLGTGLSIAYRLD